MVYTSRIRGNMDKRPKAFWGSLIPAAINFVGGLITTSQQAKAQKKAMEDQQRLAQQQLQVSNQNNLAATLNNYASAQNSYSDEDYNLKYRNGGTRRLGSNNIVITDGGNARKIGSNTFLLRGGSHEDINETGQTGIGINVGGNEIEAEGDEVAQKKNGSLRIFSAQPMLSGGLSPAQAILRGYNKDKVFAAQQRFKKNNHLNDDGSKFGNGGKARFGDWFTSLFSNDKPAPKKTVHFYKSKSDKVFKTYNEAAKDNAKYKNDIVYRYNRKGDLYHQKYGLREHNIPFQKENAITLRNAGRASGAVISPNQLDSIAKYANKAGLSIPTAFGMVMKESTFNNPTDTKSAAKLFGLSKGTKEYNDWTTGQHFQGNGTSLDDGNARHFVNFHKDDSLNPYWQDMVYTKRKAKNINEAKQMLLNGERNADKRAKSAPKLTGGKKLNVLEAAFRDYKANPYGYNPGQNNYVQLVNQNTKDIMNSPQIQQWYKTSPYAKGRRYKCGGRIKAEDGTKVSLTSSYRTIPDGGVPGTDSYSSKMRNGYNASPLNLLNVLGYADQAVGFTDENGNSRYITGIAPTAGRGKFKGKSKGKRTLADRKNGKTNVKSRNTITESSIHNVNVSGYTYDPSFRINRNQIGYRGVEDYKPNPNYNPNSNTNTNFPAVITRTPNYSTRGKMVREQLARNKDLGDAYLLNRAARNANDATANINKALKRVSIAKGTTKAASILIPSSIGIGYMLSNNDNTNNADSAKQVSSSKISSYIARPQIQKVSSSKPAVKKDSTSTIPDSIRRPQTKKDSVVTPVFKQALGKDSVKKDSVKPTRTIVKQQKTSPIRKDTTKVDTTKPVVQQKKVAAPQYKGNTTKGNYQLHDGETKVINGIKYTRKGNTIVNNKTKVGYIYDKNGNYTGQADYSKVGKNFNDAFDAARAAGRSNFIYHAGKYNNYSTAKEEDSKKEALNRRYGAKRIAKRLGGLEHARRRYVNGGNSNPWDKYKVPDYGGTAPWQVSNKYDVNVPYAIGKYDLPIVNVTAKKDNFNDEMSKRMRAGTRNLSNDNTNNNVEVPYLGRQNTFKPATQDYIGLGIDTLAALGSGLFTRSAYNKLNFDYNLPSYVDETPVAFDTTYHNEAQRANVERNRINGRNLIRGNTASAQTALSRMQEGDTNAMMELNKLADEKANKEVELRNQNAANEQQVRARNAAARNQYYQSVAQIQNAALEAKNNAALAKAQSIGADLSGLSQAWTNFAGSVENRYNARQNEAIIAATSKEPAVLSNALQFGYNFSPEVLASIYRSTNDDKLKQLALSRLSPSDRRRYSLFQ